jgi:hypothetical protein
MFVMDPRDLIIGLVEFTAGQEHTLLAAVDPAETGTPTAWSAAALVAHNSDFRFEQVQRLDAIRTGVTPPEFEPVVHESEPTYSRYGAVSVADAGIASRSSTEALCGRTRSTATEDLLDPSRHEWLRGRALWLQILVRGFWHPMGHVGEYHLRHGDAAEAVAIHGLALEAASRLDAPDQVLGMAHYSLGCAQACAGRFDESLVSLTESVRRNGELRGHLTTDVDLAAMRQDGLLAALLASP